MKELPISRPLILATVPAEGVTVEVVADAAELKALADFNEVVSVGAFSATFEVRPVGARGFSVAGRVRAETIRTCVVTLEPFPEAIDEPIDLSFSTDAGKTGAAGHDIDDDAPEPIENGTIDLGAVASEFFTLSLAPYPRKPGAAFETGDDAGEADSPFAALQQLRRGPDGAN